MTITGIVRDEEKTRNQLLADVVKLRQRLATYEAMTEHQNSDELLRVNEKTFSNLFNSIPEGFTLCEIICDEHGKPVDYRYLEFNPAFGTQTGHHREELLGKTAREVFHIVAEHWIETFGRVALTGEPAYIEEYVQSLGGWYEILSYSPAHGQFATLFRNVTERKQTEETLRRKEREAREQLAEIETIYNFVPIGLCVLSPQLRWIRINQRFAEINGVPPGEHLGKTPSEVVPDLGKQAEQALRQILLTGEPLLNYEVSGTTVAQLGVLRYWNEHWVPIKDKRGNIIGISVAAEEITEHKRLEKKLRESEERYRLLFETMSEGFALHEVILNEDGAPVDFRILDVNPANERITGLKREEIIGKTAIDISPELDPSWIKMVGQVAITGKPISVKQYFKETARWYIVYYFSPHSGRTASLHFDVTDQVMAEEVLKRDQQILEEKIRERTIELEEANQHISGILESIGESFVAFDHDLCFTYVNQAAEKLLGYSREALIGKRIDEAFPAVKMSTLEVYRQVLQDKAPRYLEDYSPSIRRWIQEGIFPSKNGICCFIRDITQSKNAEEQITRLDRLNLVGQMAAGIGHEIRNPMTTVRGFLQLLTEKEKLAEYEEMFQLMISELDRANEIITDFLSLAKDKVVEKKRQNINGIINKLLPLIQADALKSDKSISLHLGKVADLLIDEGEIKQMFLNLVRNGLEAIPPGGKLGIKTYKENGDVVFGVQNNGPPIPPEVVEKIGTPFITTKEHGTGLGLPICYRIAERHNARIEFETGDQGTTFYVKFRGN